MFEDKRKYVRLDVYSTVVYVLMGDNGPGYSALSKNISCGGMQLYLREPVVPRSRLTLDIYLPMEYAPVKAIGEVAWQEPETEKNKSCISTGIKFIEIDNTDRARVACYILDGMRRGGNKKLRFWDKVKLLFTA